MLLSLWNTGPSRPIFNPKDRILFFKQNLPKLILEEMILVTRLMSNQSSRIWKLLPILSIK